MRPYYSDEWLTVYQGDCRAVMAEMEPESVHCVVTSPPYWGLRDYGNDAQLGLEPTPEAYVESMVAVFREVRRVLRSDGTVWLNLGDSYANDGKWGGSTGGKHVKELHGIVYREPPEREVTQDVVNHLRDGGASPELLAYAERHVERGLGRAKRLTGLKPKDLVGIPWRVAFALQADGWYLRSDIIWSKPNPMPESVTDRPTKSHEYLFLLSKSPRYYFDADAVRETYANGVDGAKPWASNGGVRNVGGRTDGLTRGTAPEWEPGSGRNIRSVWTVATQPYPGAHFAVFPPKLVEPCIKAGTSEKGVCPECGSPWERETTTERPPPRRPVGKHTSWVGIYGPSATGYLGTHNGKPTVTTTGWRPNCRCEHDGGGWAPVPATVLDPFAGSGTTALVAQSLSRRAVLIDLNADYLGQVMDRNRDIPLGLTS